MRDNGKHKVEGYLMEEPTPDMLETKEFYELMQAYRHAPHTNQEAVTEAFEAVKSFIRTVVKNG